MPVKYSSNRPFIPGWVAQQYYRHGLFCASHPKLVLVFTLCGILWTCFPLLTLPIYSTETKIFLENATTSKSTADDFPRWKVGQPVAYVQQVIMKAMVHPYKKDDLIRTDAFRGPLASVFKLHLEDISSFQWRNSGLTMDHECLRTDGLSSRYQSSSATNVIPEYGCLILSPANLWKRDAATFQLDGNLISTVFNYQRSREGHSSLADLMFGMRQRDTGLTKYPVRNRQRVITYAVTIALKEHKPEFVSELRRQLLNLYPLHKENNTKSQEIFHIFFPSQLFYAEFFPFAITIFLLFLYVYFSARKIELVRSKIGIAVSAVITVLGAICMSLGLSGLSLNINSKVYLVPYLVAFISFENIIVVTRSVMSTAQHLDVKIRVAQGLSLEGWNITKNLFAQITILTMGFFIGILDSSIQEFCLLAVMGLLSDFFLQTFFFVTVLSMDISEMELSDSLTKKRDHKMFQRPVSGPGHKKASNVVAPQCNSPPKEAKRVRLLNFWAKGRIFQRFFVLFMVVWISMFIYHKSGLLETWLHKSDPFMDHPTFDGNESTKAPLLISALQNNESLAQQNISAIIADQSPTADTKPTLLDKLIHLNQNPWTGLPYTHWPMLFGLYNISLYGQFITILPPIHLSMTISPESAVKLRHPQETEAYREASAHSIESLKAALDISEDDDTSDRNEVGSPELSPFVPTSPSELFLAFVFAFPSLLFIMYLMVVFYRCVCSRNYAEWRSSWSGLPPELKPQDIYTQIVQESVPISLSGHKHEIESLVTDGNIVVSLCLEGRINTWDSYSGENVAHIDRIRYFQDGLKKPPLGEDLDRKRNSDDKLSDYESGSPGEHNKHLSNLSHRRSTSHLLNSLTLNTNFTSFRPGSLPSASSTGAFDFGRFVRADDYPIVPDVDPLNGVPAVWCMDAKDGIIVIGCANGRIEVWEALSGGFKCAYDDATGIGITHVRLVGSKVVIARLAGYIEFLDVIAKPGLTEQKAQRRQHVRNWSTGSFDDLIGNPSIDDDLHLRWVHAARAHAQPMTCLEIMGGKVLTGSQDHTLRVFRLDDHIGVYTLHGHCGPITSAFIDHVNPSCAGSGSQDGMLCVWDLLTGACVYSIQAHDGAVLSLAHSPSYVISSGTDKKLCVWERFQGHLINQIYLGTGPSCPDLIMLTHNLLVTGQQGQLIVWDARLSEPVKFVRLGSNDATHSVKVLNHTGDTVACSYGPQLRLVHFPMLSDKTD